MELEQLLLRKEELPILRGTAFHVPIHPALLRNGVQIDDIGWRVFEQAAQEWFDDLSTYCESPNVENREWIAKTFLRERPVVTKINGVPTIKYRGLRAYVVCDLRGFVKAFAPGGATGGSLHFDADDSTCQAFAHLEHTGRTLIRLEFFQYVRD